MALRRLLALAAVAAFASGDSTTPPPDAAPPLSAQNLTGGAAALEHWAHPLLRRQLFAHLSDAAKRDVYQQALEAALERATAKRERRRRVELVEVGVGVWAVAARRWLAEHRPAVRLRATVIAQEPVHAELTRATLAAHDRQARVQLDWARVLERDAAGDAVAEQSLPKKIELVVCDGFGARLTRLTEQASLLTSLHRAGRLAKGFGTIPARVSLYAQAVQSDAIRRRDRVASASGFSMEAFDAFVQATARADVPVDLATVPWTPLSRAVRLAPAVEMTKPKAFYTIALSELALAPEAPLLATAGGRLDAVAVWTEEESAGRDDTTLLLSSGHMAADGKQRHRQWAQRAFLFRGTGEGRLREGDAIPLGDATLNSDDGLRLQLGATPEEAAEPPAWLGAIETQQGWSAEWYVSMLNDLPRNDAYARAVSAAVAEARSAGGGSVHVLDIGSGEGLLSLLAAEAGADRVTAVETNAAIAAVSREVIAASGHDEKVEVVTAHSRSIGMAGVPPERRPNLLVSEIVDASLVGEGLLETVCHASSELLAPGAVVLPRRATLFAAGVAGEGVRQGFEPPPSDADGESSEGLAVDLSAWNTLMSSPDDGAEPGEACAAESGGKCAAGAGAVLTHQPIDARAESADLTRVTETATVGTAHSSKERRRPLF